MFSVFGTGGGASFHGENMVCYDSRSLVEVQ